MMGITMSSPEPSAIMDAIKALPNRFSQARFEFQDTKSTSAITSQAYSTGMKIPELREAIFLQLPLYDLLVTTQTCKEWQDFILSSPKLRRRLLHDKLSFQYAARIAQTEHWRRVQNELLAHSTCRHRDPSPALEWFFRVPQRALANGRWVEGTLIIMRCNNVHIKLPVWDDPVFQLPLDTKAYLPPDGILYWLPFYAVLGCRYLHPPALSVNPALSLEVEQREYFEKHFTSMLQDGVCEDKHCVFELSPDLAPEEDQRGNAESEVDGH